MANPNDEITQEIMKDSRYVGCWKLEDENYIPLRNKPSTQIISNTQTTLGWQWLDYER